MSAISIVGRKRNMECITAHAISDKFGDDLSTALFRKFQVFEHEHARAFADDKTITIFVEGARGAMRLFVAGR